MKSVCVTFLSPSLPWRCLTLARSAVSAQAKATEMGKVWEQESVVIYEYISDFVVEGNWEHWLYVEQL